MTNLIGICGKMGSGKDTVAQIINHKSKYKWETKRYADKLKMCASIIMGLLASNTESVMAKMSGCMGFSAVIVTLSSQNSASPSQFELTS